MISSQNISAKSFIYDFFYDIMTGKPDGVLIKGFILCGQAAAPRGLNSFCSNRPAALIRFRYDKGGFLMKNRVVVTIAQQEYTLIASEDEEYVRKIAALVDEKIGEVMEEGRISLLNAVILASTNIADSYYKSLEASENLRNQLKSYLEDLTRMKSETAELRRELAQYKK